MSELKLNLKKGTTINIKRFYLEGIEFTTLCPKCNLPCHFDGICDSISYPKVGVKEHLNMFCTLCDDWFEVPIKIEVEVTINPNK